MHDFIYSSGDLHEIDSATVNFTPGGSDILCVTIGTVDDSIVEDNETYSFIFQYNDQAISRIVPSTGEINLLDNDSKRKGGEKSGEIHDIIFQLLSLHSISRSMKYLKIPHFFLFALSFRMLSALIPISHYACRLKKILPALMIL